MSDSLEYIFRRVPDLADVFAAQFEKVAVGWRSSITHVQAAVEIFPPELYNESQAELDLPEWH